MYFSRQRRSIAFFISTWSSFLEFIIRKNDLFINNHTQNLSIIVNVVIILIINFTASVWTMVNCQNYPCFYGNIIKRILLRRQSAYIDYYIL